MAQPTPRPITEIVQDIQKEADIGGKRPRRPGAPSWQDYARPYINVLLDPALSKSWGDSQPIIVLVNNLLRYLTDWKGPRARALKKELRQAAIDFEGGGGPP